AFLIGRRLQPFHRTLNSARYRNASPQAMHREVDHRSRNIPHSKLVAFRQHDIRPRRCDYIPQMTYPLNPRRPAPAFVPVSLRPSIALKAVIPEHIEVADFVSRKSEGAHFNSQFASGSNASGKLAIGRITRTTFIAKDHVRKGMATNLLRHRAGSYFLDQAARKKKASPVFPSPRTIIKPNASLTTM